VRRNQDGLTLVELLMATAILAMLSVATVSLVSSMLHVHHQVDSISRLYREGLLAMHHMTYGVRSCTFLLIPNAQKKNRDILVFSGLVNEDGDAYFDDPLFPRVDEDPGRDMTSDGVSGIINIDDDGDGNVDEPSATDDDEDGHIEEDPLNGVDDDGDGNIDEDLDDDIHQDFAPGLRNMDDDGDGAVDEGSPSDDDEDGLIDEDGLNPLIYVLESSNATLWEVLPQTGLSNSLCTHVTRFDLNYKSPEKTQITLELTTDDGESITFEEVVFVRNVLQKTGKRVR